MGGLTETATLFALKTGLDLVQAEQQARTQIAAAESAAQFQRQQAQQAQLIRERERRERLRRVLASQRAQFGAHGVGAGGSADAVLKGLTNDTKRGIRDGRNRLGLSLDAIDRQLEQQRRRNLLELSDIRRRSAFGVLQQGLGGFTSLLEP
jgi:hypothetical protein